LIRNVTYQLIRILATFISEADNTWNCGRYKFEFLRFWVFCLFLTGFGKSLILTCWLRSVGLTGWRAMFNGDKWMIHPITGIFLSACPFSKRFQWQPLRWFCVTNHLACRDNSETPLTLIWSNIYAMPRWQKITCYKKLHKIQWSVKIVR